MYQIWTAMVPYRTARKNERLIMERHWFHSRARISLLDLSWKSPSPLLQKSYFSLLATGLPKFLCTKFDPQWCHMNPPGEMSGSQWSDIAVHFGATISLLHFAWKFPSPFLQKSYFFFRWGPDWTASFEGLLQGPAPAARLFNILII